MANLTVSELSRMQLFELKQNYLNNHLLEVEDRSASYNELANADEIVDDEIIFENYSSVLFSDDDFSASAASVYYQLTEDELYQRFKSENIKINKNTIVEIFSILEKNHYQLVKAEENLFLKDIETWSEVPKSLSGILLLADDLFEDEIQSIYTETGNENDIEIVRLEKMQGEFDLVSEKNRYNKGLYSGDYLEDVQTLLADCESNNSSIEIDGISISETEPVYDKLIDYAVIQNLEFFGLDKKFIQSKSVIKEKDFIKIDDECLRDCIRTVFYEAQKNPSDHNLNLLKTFLMINDYKPQDFAQKNLVEIGVDTGILNVNSQGITSFNIPIPVSGEKISDALHILTNYMSAYKIGTDKIKVYYIKQENKMEQYKNTIVENYKKTGDFIASLEKASNALSHDEFVKVQADLMKHTNGDKLMIKKVIYSWNPDLKLKDPCMCGADNLPVVDNNSNNEILLNKDAYNQTRMGLILDHKNKVFALWHGQALTATTLDSNTTKASRTEILKRARFYAKQGYIEGKTGNEYAETSLAFEMSEKEFENIIKLPKITAKEIENHNIEEFGKEYCSSYGIEPEDIKAAAINAKPDCPAAQAKMMTANNWWEKAVDHAYHGCSLPLLDPQDEIKLLEKHNLIPQGSYDRNFDYWYDDGKASDLVAKTIFKFAVLSDVIDTAKKPAIENKIEMER